MVFIDQEKNGTSDIFVLKEYYTCKKQLVQKKTQPSKQTNKTPIFTYVIVRLMLLSGGEKKHKVVLHVSIFNNFMFIIILPEGFFYFKFSRMIAIVLIEANVKNRKKIK